MMFVTAVRYYLLMKKGQTCCRIQIGGSQLLTRSVASKDNSILSVVAYTCNLSSRRMRQEDHKCKPEPTQFNDLSRPYFKIKNYSSKDHTYVKIFHVVYF